MDSVTLDAGVRPRRRRQHDPIEDAALRARIETVLAAAKRHWPCLDDIPGRNKMSRILVADETVKEIGYTEHTVRKILGGDYPASRRLNIPGYLNGGTQTHYQ